MVLNPEIAQEKVPINIIHHGVKLPVDLIDEYCMHHLVPWKGEDVDIGPGSLWNMGSGFDETKTRMYREMGFVVINSDINKSVVIEEQKAQDISVLSSAAEFGDRLGALALLSLETVSTVWMGGLLENMGTAWRGAFQTAFMSLAPTGFLVIGGVARADEDNPALLSTLGRTAYREYQEKWKRRYATAHRYDQRRYPFGSFPVASPGPLKKLEWGPTSDLDRLTHSNAYERDAQHMAVSTLITEAGRYHMKVLHYRPEVWQARTEGDKYSGYTLVFQKEAKYYFDPFKADLSWEEAGKWAEMNGTQSIRRALGETQYWKLYKKKLLQHCARNAMYVSHSVLEYVDHRINGTADTEYDPTGWRWLMPDPVGL